MKALLWLAILLFIAWIVFWAVVKVIGAVFWILLGLAVAFFIFHLITRASTAART
ncbi:MAG: hypothetical protein ROO76_19270 [Terriglobia bacterium]|jgi:hypothetical protein|nr:hypothetical protein [Terriglobia bacterium]